jgi:signal transduction histidine kinase
VSVVDTGQGISPADLPQVFSAFYRGDKSRSKSTGGAGLGLAIARGIVRLHHGDLTVESTPGVGSQFMFTLP